MNFQRISIAAALMLMGLSAGFFFTYEASVTLGLAEVDDVAYVETFQAINATIRNMWFGIVFFGSVPALVLALAAHRNSPTRVKASIGLALALYLVCVGITMAGNVPLNDELAAVTDVNPESAAQARLIFEDDWNTLNLLRTLAVVAGFGSLAFAATSRCTLSSNPSASTGDASDTRDLVGSES